MPLSKEDIDRDPGDYSIKRLSKENLVDLVKLYADVYNRRIPVEHFIQKYNTAFTGTEYVGYIAYDNDQQPIAYYGVMPCFIQFLGLVRWFGTPPICSSNWGLPC